jgi:hypothetical protein
MLGPMSGWWYLRLTLWWRPLPNRLTYNFRLPMLLLAREIVETRFNEVFRASFVPGPSLTSWRLAHLPHRTI